MSYVYFMSIQNVWGSVEFAWQHKGSKNKKNMWTTIIQNILEKYGKP